MAGGIEADALAEVVRLHEVIEGWIRGTLSAEADFDAGFAAAMHPDLVICAPSGAEVPIARMLPALREGRATNPAFRIRIEEARPVAAWPEAALVAYVERQEGAIAAPKAANARRATALILAGRPMLWRHLHETWIDA